MIMNRKKEQGIALLYALGILALLTAMALAFINSSIFDQRASAQSASSIMAEQLAISTMERLIWGIQQSNAKDPNAKSGLTIDTASFSYMPDKHYSYDGNSPVDPYWGIARDGLVIGSMINDITVKKDVLYVEDLKNHFVYRDNNYRNNVRWILHRMRTGETNEVPSKPINRVIGRTAFIIVPIKGQINPSDLVSENVNESTGASDRIGKNMYEIDIKAIETTLGTDSKDVFGDATLVKFFNYPSQGGARPRSGWDDSFFRKLPTVYKNDADVRDAIDAVFTFNTKNSGEYYTMDINNELIANPNKVFSDREHIHRFYLPRFSNAGEYWDRLTPTPPTNYWDEGKFDINREILLDTNNDGIPDIGLAPDSKDFPAHPDLRLDYRFDNDRPGTPVVLGISVPQKIHWGLGIPWLAGFGLDASGNPDESLKGTFDLVKHRRQQIAANLKDYCDSDDVPTSDVDPVNWGYQSTPPTNVPTYTGNEKTPYINELEIATDAKVSVIDNTAGGGDKTATVVLEMFIAGEVINIYKNLPDPPVTTKLQVLCRISGAEVIVKWFNNTATTPEPIIFDGINPPITIDGNPNSYIIDLPTPWTEGDTGHFYGAMLPISSSFSLDAKAVEYGTPLVWPDKGEVTVKYKITIDKVILEQDGKNVDYANINKEIDFVEILTFDDSGTTKNFVHSVQTEDPRQNLNPGDWELTTGSSATGYASPPSNIGKINANSNPNAPTAPAGEFDIELTTNPAYAGDVSTGHISTAYIRNAPMISPWELGFIHRGKKWQTINLKAYDHDKAFKTFEPTAGLHYLVGGGIYSKGDANILDQIKMTPDKESPLKVNLKGGNATDPFKKMEMVLNGLLDVKTMGLNGTEDFVGRAILESKNSGALYSALRNELLGTSGSPTALGAVNSEIRDKFDPTKTTGEYDTRAALANITDIGNAGTTDAAQEEWIGKVINLTETRRGLDIFEIVIVSQAIQDVGSSDGSNFTIRKFYRNPINHKLEGPVPIRDCKLGEVNFGQPGTKNSPIVLADEILAQRKIRVRGYRKPNGSVQILSIKTVE